jgi:probable rRNA maturation factor
MKSRNVRDVQVANLYARARVSAPTVVKLIATLDTMRAYRCPTGEISVVFVNDREIVRLHKEFMDDATVTDVMTFVGEDHPGEPFAGEICVNVDQAKRAAKERNCAWVDELTLYVVHGWLHLAGLRDKKSKEARLMRVAEAEALAFLRKKKIKLRILK